MRTNRRCENVDDDGAVSGTHGIADLSLSKMSRHRLSRFLKCDSSFVR